MGWHVHIMPRMVRASLGLAASFIILSIVANLCKEVCCMLQKQNHVPARQSSQHFLRFFREQRAACATMTAPSAFTIWSPQHGIGCFASRLT